MSQGKGTGSTARGRFSRFVRRFFMIVGICVTVLAMGAIVAVLIVINRKPAVPASTILELRLDRPIKESPNATSLTSVFEPAATTLPQLVRALDEGSKDPKVKGLIAWVGGSHGMATLQELRDAIARFRGAGKFALAFAPSFGEMTGGTGQYYVATACDEIWIQPSGMLGVTGLRAEVPFLKGVFGNIGVEVEGGKRKAYKNAYNTFTESGFTPPHKESTEALLAEVLDQLAADISRARKLDVEKVRALFAQGPFLPEQALAEKLVDHIGYRDQVVAAAKSKAQGEGELLYATKYLERLGKDDLEDGEGAKLAIVYGTGTIMPGRGSLDPLSGESGLGADTVAAALRAAARDDAVKAVILRIDSPGGSYVASDTIWRETLEVKAKGKPLVVSMGNVAASGGYFIAMDATKIVAEPATLTGSIGVYSMKLVTKDLWSKLGLSWGTVSTSANAAMWSSLSNFSAEDRRRVDAWLDFVYGDFTGKVAAGRKLSAAAVEEAAQGRVWTGRRAKELGLVDEIGGLDRAVAVAKEASGIAADAPVRLVAFPEHRGLVRLLLDRDRDSSDDDVQSAPLRVGLLEEAKAWAAAVHRARSQIGETGALHAPAPQLP